MAETADRAVWHTMLKRSARIFKQSAYRGKPVRAKGVWVQIVLSFLLAVCLHAAPMIFWMHGQEQRNALELELFNLYRNRVFRDMEPQQLTMHSVQAPPMPIDAPFQTNAARRVSKPRSAESMDRTRAVQRAIRVLWDSMGTQQAGYALVSMRVLENGFVGDCAILRVSGDDEFRTFLLSFLTTLTGSRTALVGPGESLRIECEFVVQPTARKGA